MKGLILKDLYTLKSYGKQYAFIFLFMLVIAFGTGNISMLSTWIVIVGGMIVMTSMSVDENSHFDRLALTMPVSMKTLVASKYLLLILSLLAGSILAFVISMVYGLIKNDFDGVYNLAAIPVYAIVWSVSYPVMFKKGVEKSRYIFMAVMAFFFVLIFGVLGLRSAGISFDFLNDIAAELENISVFEFVLAIVAASLLSLWVSYRCSLWAVRNKEW